MFFPPYQQASGSDWYKGTANAIYQNISFIERYNPQYVIILSGDQICKQDYSDFLRFHKEKGAGVQRGSYGVPWDEASRFSLMVADEDSRITEFRRAKESKVKSGFHGYLHFNWDILKKYLIEDEADPNSQNDFGNNIIQTFFVTDVICMHIVLMDIGRMNLELFLPCGKQIWRFLILSTAVSICSMKTGRFIAETAV